MQQVNSDFWCFQLFIF